MDDELRRALWVGARDVLKRAKFVEVITDRERSRSYWKRPRDGAYALLSPKPNGEPQVVRLDDGGRKAR